MLWIHPFIQFTVTLAAFYVLYLGWQRARMLHFKARVPFNWKRHALLGRAVIIIWLAGLLAGKLTVYVTWDMSPVFLDHTRGAMLMTPFMFVAYLTGSFMDRRRKKRTLLPLVHAVNNLILLLTALYQAWTGYQIVTGFLV